jgi:ABC-type transport system substrate-binding protein/class 3 adenylate cyclase
VQPDTSVDVGERGAGRESAGPVTFLFTDVEGSTRLLRDVGAGVFGRILLEHDRVVREAVEARGGHVVDTQGDAFFVAFRDAEAGVAAAVAVQEAIATHAWPGGGRVLLRMGLHTGDPEVAGERYLGLDVHLGARVAAAAHGGQVLVTGATRAYLDVDRSELRVRRLGEFPLKDFDAPQELFQVAAGAMEDEFPPLRTGEAREGAFAGREQELADAAVASLVRAARRRERRRVLALIAAVFLPVAVAGALFVTRSQPVHVAPNSVAVLDASSGRLVGDVPLGGPTPSRIVAGGGDVWVLNPEGQTLSRIDAATRKLATFGLSQQPTDLAVSGGDVWVVNGLARTISVVDAHTLSAVLKVPLSGHPGILDTGDAWVSPSRRDVWVSTAAGLSEYSTAGNLVRHISGVPDGPLAATNAAVWLGGGYGAFGPSGTVERVDAQTGRTAAQIATGPADTVVVGGGWVWAAGTDAGTVRRIDPTRNATVGSTRVPGVDALAASGNSLWAASGNGAVVRISLRNGRILSRTQVGGHPVGLAVAGGRVWVAIQPAMPVRQGGGLRVSVASGAIDHIDPAFAFQAISWQILYATDLNLLTYPDAPAAAGLRLVPSAAVSMPRISDHDHRYSFVVRRGYRFSPPSGKPVTAASFRAAIERAIKIGPRSRAAFLTGDIVGAKGYAAGKTRHIRGVQVHGQRISITTTDINPAFLSELALPLFSAVPTNAPIRTTGDTAIPSAGSYYVKSYTPDQQLILMKNPNYEGPRSAHLTRITYQISHNSSWRLVASGKADYDPGDQAPPGSVIARLDRRAARAGHRQLLVNAAIGPSIAFLALNTHGSLFRHRAARQAVNYAINRAALAATIGPPGATPTDQYLPSNMPGYPGNGHVYPLGHPDLHRAEQLMHQSGIQLPVTAILYTCTNPGCRVRTSLLTRELEPIGIHLRVRRFGGDEFDQVNAGRGFDMADTGVTFPVEDPAFLFTAGFGFLNVGPYQAALAHANHIFPPQRASAFSTFDLALAKRYAPLAAYAVPEDADFFSRRVGCQVYQPVFGIDLTQLCIRASEPSATP